jgi:hypothetical protein
MVSNCGGITISTYSDESIEINRRTSALGAHIADQTWGRPRKLDKKLIK